MRKRLLGTCPSAFKQIGRTAWYTVRIEKLIAQMKGKKTNMYWEEGLPIICFVYWLLSNY